MRRLIVAMSLLICILLVGVTAYKCKAQPQVHVDNVPRTEIDKWLKEEVVKSGGDWNNGRFSFYFGFATGGFKSDPVSALAMKRLAWGLMNNTLAAGDKLTAVGFEMGAYDIKNPILLTSDKQTRADFVDATPGTPKDNSTGGHDLEHAMFDVINHIPKEEDNKSIVLLFNTDNHSQNGNQPGENFKKSDLDSLISEKGFRSTLVKQAFHLKSNGQPVDVAITALFPSALKSLGGDGPRFPTFPRESWQPSEDAPTSSENLPNETATNKPVVPVNHDDTQKSNFPWGLVGIIALLVIAAIVVFMVLGKRSGVQSGVKKPVVAVEKTVDKVEIIPGTIKATIGPDEQSISPLPKGGAWTLLRTETGLTTLALDGATEATPNSPSPTGIALASVKLLEDRTLKVDSVGGSQFTEIQGTASDKSDSRSMTIEPGKRVLCRVVSSDGTAKTRFELVYDSQSSKSGRA